ncbi:hypothetical protein NHX12_007516 [Muraenolepis orangiensis]|uniref:Secreted protein n=1 Tax=Muraenolepis orangiensis TaxID=630683 RepID=A0A9Q0IB96_9TELE|nr:hypothetical protein NHX12_007516 [Muraenolepis orangiensis]
MARTALACVLWWRWLGILVMFQGMEAHSGIRTGSQAAASAPDGIPSRQANRGPRSIGSIRCPECVRLQGPGLTEPLHDDRVQV